MTENEYLREQIAGLKAELSSLKAAGTGSTFKFIDDPELGTIVEKSQDGYIAELRGEIADLKAAGTRADGIEAAARVAYVVCVKSRHVSLGDEVAAAIRALSPASPKPVVGEIIAALRTKAAELRVCGDDPRLVNHGAGPSQAGNIKADALEEASDEIASRFGKEGGT